MNANAERNQRNASSNCHQIAASTSAPYAQKHPQNNPTFLVISHHSYHSYRHFKAKLLIVDPSEGRGFNFHTLAKKLVLDLGCSAPQRHAWRGV